MRLCCFMLPWRPRRGTPGRSFLSASCMKRTWQSTSGRRGYVMNPRLCLRGGSDSSEGVSTSPPFTLGHLVKVVSQAPEEPDAEEPGPLKSMTPKRTSERQQVITDACMPSTRCPLCAPPRRAPAQANAHRRVRQEANESIGRPRSVIAHSSAALCAHFHHPGNQAGTVAEETGCMQSSSSQGQLSASIPFAAQARQKAAPSSTANATLAPTCLQVDRNTMVLAVRCVFMKLHNTSILS